MKTLKEINHEFKNSSNLNSLVYLPAVNELLIRFNKGGQYIYENVPFDLVKELINQEQKGESAGKFFFSRIRSKFNFVKL